MHGVAGTPVFRGRTLSGYEGRASTPDTDQWRGKKVELVILNHAACGRNREPLGKSLNNHVFPLIYSKYLSGQQIKPVEGEPANAWAEGCGAGTQGSAFVLIRRIQCCRNYPA